MHGSTSRTLARPVTEPGPLSAPLFREVVETLRAGGRSVVLDLGAACPETVALLTGFRCRLDIADLADGIDALNAEDDPHRLLAAAEALLPPRRQEATDLVLCWDVLNYLGPAALTALMDCVAARARRGTLAHFLVVYSANRMPARPGRYAPQADGRLKHVPATGGDRPAPRYTPEALNHYLRGYTVEGARLLQNGMQEFLYRL